MATVVGSKLEILYREGREASRAGRHEEALLCFEEIVRPENRRDIGEDEGDFLALSHMGVAYSLMDLGRYVEAEIAFREGWPYLDQLETPYIYDYLYSLGNCLGEAGRLDEMAAVMAYAIKIAYYQLGDPRRCARVWAFSFTHARKARNWAVLHDLATECLTFCAAADIPALKEEAERVLGEARAHQGIRNFRKPRRPDFWDHVRNFFTRR
jgi:tetratricopeptide (TPR) repeat protein